MSDDQFQQIARSFDKLDARFDRVEKRLDEQDETILKLYQHFEQRFDRLDATKADKDQVAKLQDTMDGIVARFDTDDQERAAINHQLDRHERWIGRAAKRVGVSYEP